MHPLFTFIRKKAKEKLRTVVICEGWDERVLKATAKLLKEKLCRIILLGDEKIIKEKMKTAGVKFDAEIINPKTAKQKKDLAHALYERRKSKGMTPEEANKLIEDVNYFGATMVLKGLADGMSGSCICSTAELMRPALQVLGTAEGSNLVSEVAIMHDTKKDRLFFVSDCSLNVDPTPEQLAQIALNAAECARYFHYTPKIALLSFSTKGSGEHPILAPLRKTLEMVKQRNQKLLIDGEMQVDAAVNPDAARRKCPDSPLKGGANILIFPNLSVGNIFCHALLQFSEMEFLFSMLMGIKKPVTIMGRSVDAEHIERCILLTAAQANMMDNV